MGLKNGFTRLAFLLIFVFVCFSINSVFALPSVSERDKSCLLNASNGFSESDFLVVATSSELGNTYAYVGDSSLVYDLDFSGCGYVPESVSLFDEIISLNIEGLGLESFDFSIYPNLFEVYASNNQLSNVDSLGDNIEILDVSNNSITSSSRILELLELNLADLNIDHNPLGEAFYEELRDRGIAIDVIPSITIYLDGVVYSSTSIEYIAESCLLSWVVKYQFENIDLRDSNGNLLGYMGSSIILHEGVYSLRASYNGNDEVIVLSIRKPVVNLPVIPNENGEIINNTEEVESATDIEEVEAVIKDDEPVEETLLEVLPNTSDQFNWVWFILGLLLCVFGIKLYMVE